MTEPSTGHPFIGIWNRLRELWVWPPDVASARLKGDLDLLTEALRYKDDYVREEAATALAEEGAEGIAILRRALADPDPRVRESATHGLTNVEYVGLDEQTRATLSARLCDTLADPDPHCRSGAATALGRCAGPEALDALKAAIADPVEEVRLAVLAAVGRLDPETLERWSRPPARPSRRPRTRKSSPSTSPDGTPEPDPLAWLLPPGQTRSTASRHSVRKTMVPCPRCQRLGDPGWVRCHRCGARMRP